MSAAKDEVLQEFAARWADVAVPGFEAADPREYGLLECCRFLTALSCSSTASTTMALLSIAHGAMKLRPLSPGHLRRGESADLIVPIGMRSEWLPPGFACSRRYRTQL